MLSFSASPVIERKAALRSTARPRELVGALTYGVHNGQKSVRQAEKKIIKIQGGKLIMRAQIATEAGSEDTELYFSLN